jgi:CubicO group peptidase (beta-lactamase class C family)
MTVRSLIAVACLATTLEAQQATRAPRLVAALESLPPAPTSNGVWRSLRHRMDSAAAPGLSVAVIDDYRVVEVAAYGVADATTEVPITPATLFQAASLSKPVFALGVLRLVQARALDLDAPVNKSLHAWQLPSSTTGSADGVTLRRILNHTAGLTMSAVPSYRVGEALPSLVDVLRGDGTTDGVRVEAPPGSRTVYSGGGYAIAQLMVEEATRRGLAEVMDSLVLRPLGMTASTFDQPLVTAWASRAATGHRDDGSPVTGRWRVFNVQSAAGLWTTPSDLARYIIAVQHAVNGMPGAILDSALAATMLRAERSGGVRGLGPVVQSVDGGAVFSHGGWNAGYRAYFAATFDGRGVVVFANGNRAGEFVRDVARQAALAYGWKTPD